MSAKRSYPRPRFGAAVKNLDALAEELARTFDALDEAREIALAKSREVVRHSGSAIKAAHRGEPYAPHLAEAERAAHALREAVHRRPLLESAGFTEMAFQELTEAHLVAAALEGRDFPRPEEIGVPPAAFVLGMGDLVGELRRMALDALVAGDAEGARRRLAEMEDVYATLMRFDYPTALLDVRRKQDTARGLLERTRGEVAVALRGQAMEARMAELARLLERK